MKIIKIIIGFFILFGTGNEYINASRQLGSLFHPDIIIVTLFMLLLSTWLIGSGFSGKKFQFKSYSFLFYFFISFVIFFIVAFFSSITQSVPTNHIEINGLKVPLENCIDGNKKVIPNKKEREKYCICLVEKITNDPESKLKYKEDLEAGNIIVVVKEIFTTSKFQEFGIEDCMTTTNIIWTDNLSNSMKKNLKSELIGTEFGETNDIDIYCDCIISEYQKYTVDKIKEDGFAESNEALDIDEKCIKQSEK